MQPAECVPGAAVVGGVLLLEIVGRDEPRRTLFLIARCGIPGGQAGHGHDRLIRAAGLPVEVADSRIAGLPGERSRQSSGERDVLARARLGVAQRRPRGVVAVSHAVTAVPGRARGGFDRSCAVHLGPVRRQRIPIENGPGDGATTRGEFAPALVAGRSEQQVEGGRRWIAGVVRVGALSRPVAGHQDSAERGLDGFHVENRLAESNAGGRQLSVVEGLTRDDQRSRRIEISIGGRRSIRHGTVPPVPAQGLIGAQQVLSGPRPDRPEGRLVVQGDGHQHGVRLTLADRVAILVAAHDPTVRIDVRGEESASGLLGGEAAHGRRVRGIRGRGTGISARTPDHEYRDQGDCRDGDHPDRQAPGHAGRLHPATLRSFSPRPRR